MRQKKTRLVKPKMLTRKKNSDSGGPQRVSDRGMMLVAAMLNDASIEQIPEKKNKCRKTAKQTPPTTTKRATQILLKTMRKGKQTHAFIETDQGKKEVVKMTRSLFLLPSRSHASLLRFPPCSICPSGQKCDLQTPRSSSSCVQPRTLQRKARKTVQRKHETKQKGERETGASRNDEPSAPVGRGIKCNNFQTKA